MESQTILSAGSEAAYRIAIGACVCAWGVCFAKMSTRLFIGATGAASALAPAIAALALGLSICFDGKLPFHIVSAATLCAMLLLNKKLNKVPFAAMADPATRARVKLIAKTFSQNSKAGQTAFLCAACAPFACAALPETACLPEPARGWLLLATFLCAFIFVGLSVAFGLAWETDKANFQTMVSRESGALLARKEAQALRAGAPKRACASSAKRSRRQL